jgi:hypothetical protein
MGYCQGVLVDAASDHPKVKRTDYFHRVAQEGEAYWKELVAWEDLRGLSLRELVLLGLALREVSVLLQAQQLSLLPNPLYGYLLQPLF